MKHDYYGQNPEEPFIAFIFWITRGQTVAFMMIDKIFYWRPSKLQILVKLKAFLFLSLWEKPLIIQCHINISDVMSQAYVIYPLILTPGLFISFQLLICNKFSQLNAIVTGKSRVWIFDEFPGPAKAWAAAFSCLEAVRGSNSVITM